MSDPKSSITSPLRIAEVPYPGSTGIIGVTLCPGKKQSVAISGTWARDLQADLDVVHCWGAIAVVTLVEKLELLDLGVESIGSEVCVRGMAWHHLPIKDQDVPTEYWERRWNDIGPSLHRLLASNCRILVHCRGGLGRSGLLAARILLEAGMTPGDAVCLVRRHRRNAIQTGEQEQYIWRTANLLCSLEAAIPENVREILIKFGQILSSTFPGNFATHRLEALIDRRSVQLSFFGIDADGQEQGLALVDDLEEELGAALLQMTKVVPEGRRAANLEATFTTYGLKAVTLRPA